MYKRIEYSYTEGSEEAMTLAEIFRQEGRQEEKKETLYKTAIRLLTKKFGKLPDITTRY